MPRLFGTDGVRGEANSELTADLALTLGRAAGSVLAPNGGEVVVGRDTRLSGPMLQGALVAGLCSAGAHVLTTGILPTPAVAFLVKERRAQAGAVISASHNPVADNGIKFFSDEGTKIASTLEEHIEGLMEAPPGDLPTHERVGTAEPLDRSHERYTDHLLSTLDGSLSGIKVVLDCAFGAAYEVAPAAFERAGAEVIAINAEADGARINVDCGSTSLDGLSKRVVASGSAVGFGFDGDADRVLAVDENGDEVDGDRILGMLATRLHDQGILKNDVVVSTVMANLGFRRALEARGITVLTAPVGDRFVVEEMLATGALLGGEQSGHIIMGEHATTGDGTLTALQVASLLLAEGEPLSKLAHFFEPYPQVLLNIRVRSRDELEGATELWEQVAGFESDLGDEGRILVRASGTEPLVRVMVEAAAETTARSTAEALADTVRRTLA